MSSPDPIPLPSVTPEEVLAAAEKSEVIYLRLTPNEKEAVKVAAKALRLTATEYLLKCHELVSSKIPTESKG